MSRLKPEEIKNYSGFAVRNTPSIPHLRSGRYRVVPQPITGDAPKAFVRIYEYDLGTRRRNRPGKWPAYIAKVGHKWYPNESITEHLLTRIGEYLGLEMAHSRLMEVHGQVRFFSRYFLKENQSLVHGAQIFAGYLEDEAFVEEVEKAGAAREMFTFQFVEEAIHYGFPDQAEAIMKQFIRMLAFDAIVGNNDRHYYNWGVVVHALGAHEPYFSPIYDSARALFWNDSEDKLESRWKNTSLSERNQFLKKYVKNSRPKTGCDGVENLNHFCLLERLYEHKPAFQPVLKNLYRPDLLNYLAALFENEFRDLFSSARKEVIKACVAHRLERYGKTLKSGGTCP